MEEKNYLKDREYLFKDRSFGATLNNSRLYGVFFNLTASAPKDKTLGVDVSHWNGNSDFAKMESKGIKWGIFKGTDVGSASGQPFTDDKADYNYTNMKKSGMLVGSYCWLDPRFDPRLQADYFLNNIYFKYDLDFPAVLDFEDRNVISYSDMLYKAQVWLETVTKKTGRKPIVYTSPGYMSSFDRQKSSFLSAYDLWIAHYIQRSYPTIPFPWTEYTMWQYSDRGNYPYFVYPPTGYYGRDWGSDSGYLDMNWFNGTYFNLLDYLNIEDVPQPPEPPQPPEEEEEVLFNAECVTTALNVRNGPSTAYAVLYQLKYGNVVPVYEVKNGWYRIRENAQEWCSGYYKYMQKTDEEENGNESFRAKCIVHALSVRTGPSTGYPIVDYLRRGYIVNVYEVKDGWYKISKDKEEWCSGSSKYMERL